MKTAVNKRIKQNISLFGKKLTQKGIPINKLVLFGSYAKKRANRFSDIDVAVISSKFGRDEMKEMQMLAKEAYPIDDKIEAFPIPLKDYLNDATPFIYEIKKYGINLK